jgi:hypothetical protein
VPAEQTPQEAKAVPYEFRQDLTLYYLFVFGDKEVFGHVDAAGTFIADRGLGVYRRGQAYSGLPPHASLNLPHKYPHEPVYEYRSGRLVPGKLDNHGIFFPDVGDTVNDFQDYRVVPSARRIFNLPGLFLENGKKGTAPPKYVLPARVDPPVPTGVPAGYDYQPFSRLAEEAPLPWVARVWHEQMELGHLSDQGDFVPDYGLPPYPLTKPAKQVVDRLTHQPAPWTYNLPVEGADREHVYEYRTGRLLKGVLLRNGTFVPELNSRVLDFKEYVPGAQALRIYNLPGRLTKKPPAPPAPEADTSKKPPRQGSPRP